jgi:hypothetical protein
MERPDHEHNNILAWLILGYLCSHPEAKDTVAGIGQWWLRLEGVNVDRMRIGAALEYLDQRGWLTTKGRDLTVYGLNRDRQQALQSFLQFHNSPETQGQDGEPGFIPDSLPSV